MGISGQGKDLDTAPKTTRETKTMNAKTSPAAPAATQTETARIASLRSRLAPYSFAVIYYGIRWYQSEQERDQALEAAGWKHTAGGVAPLTLDETLPLLGHCHATELDRLELLADGVFAPTPWWQPEAAAFSTTEGTTTMKTERLTTSDLLDQYAPLAAAVATHLSQGDEDQALDLLETDYADMAPLAAAALTDCDSGSVETPAPGATRHDLKEQAAAIVREADAEEMAQLLQDEAAVDAELEADRAAEYPAAH